jgi:type II secretory pathway pseudopilin PulG
MGRAFGLISIVVSLGLVGILWALTMQHSGPTSATAQKAERDASAAVSAINFTAAATQLEAYHAENATYVGASVPPSFGVTLMRAYAASYCLQTGVGTSAQHFTGPGGAVAAGPC